LSILKEPESLLGENVSLECNFHGSPLPLGIADPPAENSGMLAVSIKKSFRVARDFS
jgi:hypothetical protein